MVWRSFLDSAVHPKFSWFADALTLEVQFQQFYYLESTLAQNPLVHILKQQLLIFHALAHFVVFSGEVVCALSFFVEGFLIAACPLFDAVAEIGAGADFAAHGPIHSSYNTVVQLISLSERFLHQWLKQRHRRFILIFAERLDVLWSHGVDGEDWEGDGAES